MTPKQEYNLSDLMNEVNLVIRTSFDRSYWVVAEVANVSTSPVGHMYFELVEKSGPQIIAKARANLWSSKKNQIIRAFEDITQETIKRGMKVLFQLTVVFHPVYGISFQIHDIDPAYSLGELQREKQETIKKLEAEGLLDFNKQYILNAVIQNMAIISSETAAGYQDFMTQLTNNKQAYHFNTTIYPAIMQGDTAAKSIINAITAIEKTQIDYDAVVIIRGGGSNLDLACFDDYELNARLSQSFFPILSGIGHERDISVTDMIAHTRLKTPTAVAEFILQHNIGFDEEIHQLFNKIADFSKYFIEEHQHIMENSSRVIVEKSRYMIDKENNGLRNCSFHINKSSLELISKNRLFLRHQKSEITHSAKDIKTQNNYILTN
ncbi:MAG: exodeoxyribonuclease VII large subunit, partial [Bacteroidales bacterium]|nr:exodeoxyribonuclease VII large subunit [Bacteroidales bacterium]